jgi:hypothetical protein
LEAHSEKGHLSLVLRRYSFLLVLRKYIIFSSLFSHFFSFLFFSPLLSVCEGYET